MPKSFDKNAGKYFALTQDYYATGDGGGLGNDKKKGVSDIKWGSSLAASVGGQIGRFTAGPAAPVQQYLDVMVGGLLASLVVNYMAMTSDGDNWAFKNPQYKTWKEFKDDKTKTGAKVYAGIDAKDSFCYVRRGEDKGYWVNAVCMGNYSATSVMVGYDTIANFVAAAAILIVRHGGVANNLRELLGLLAGITIGSEGYTSYVGTGYQTRMIFDPTATDAGVSTYAKAAEGALKFGGEYDSTTKKPFMTDATFGTYKDTKGMWGK
jgi:hypothetical protein